MSHQLLARAAPCRALVTWRLACWGAPAIPSEEWRTPVPTLRSAGVQDAGAVDSRPGVTTHSTTSTMARREWRGFGCRRTGWDDVGSTGFGTRDCHCQRPVRSACLWHQEVSLITSDMQSCCDSMWLLGRRRRGLSGQRRRGCCRQCLGTALVVQRWCVGLAERDELLTRRGLLPRLSPRRDQPIGELSPPVGEH